MNHSWPKGWSETLTNINQATVFWEMGPEDQDYFLRSRRTANHRSPTGTSRELLCETY